MEPPVGRPLASFKMTAYNILGILARPYKSGRARQGLRRDVFHVTHVPSDRPSRLNCGRSFHYSFSFLLGLFATGHLALTNESITGTHMSGCAHQGFEKIWSPSDVCIKELLKLPITSYDIDRFCQRIKDKGNRLVQLRAWVHRKHSDFAQIPSARS